MITKTILSLGAGYVGGPTMAKIAEKCKDVTVYVGDLNQGRINAWNSDQLPVFEPGLDEIVKKCRGKNLHFIVPTEEHYKKADMIFVSVNTPTKSYGEGAGMAADLQYWELAARGIGQYARPGTIIVEKSTVPVKTAEAISVILNSEGVRYPVLSNPEFLAEGTAMKDLENPDRVLIGHEEDEQGRMAAGELKALYARWVPEEKILLTNVWSSELSKLTANAFLAQRVSSINSISALCEKTGASVAEISRAIGTDSRIGAKFLEASVGFGGSCFKKDILNLSYLSAQFGLPEVSEYWHSVVRMNDYQQERFVKQILSEQFNTVAGKKIVILGFAFKPDTNDTRESPAIYVCKRLLEEKAHLAIVDPQALGEAKTDLKGIDENVVYTEDAYAAAEGAHALVILTHWRQFGELDYRKIYSAMKKPAFLFDGRRLLDREKMYEIGFNVYSIGAKPLKKF
ncbi:MAG: nucleotide sugar dehydrogenase [Leptospiraceae bacterium]|nr:nucleotide sugar dehydrogenase [Leptospiraceae bacterium]